MSRNDTKTNIDVINFGCRLNALEGDQILDAAKNAGLTNATIINSCAVTEEAMRQARKSARKAKRDNPDHKIIVTGCAAQTDAAQFASMTEVDHVIGNMEKTEASSYAPQAPKLAVSDIMAERNAKIAKPGITQNEHARLFKFKTAATTDARFVLFHSGAVILDLCPFMMSLPNAEIS